MTALRQFTETQRAAHYQRVAFHAKIAAKAAALAAPPPAAPSSVLPSTPEAVPADPDPPKRKKQWFSIIGISGIAHPSIEQIKAAVADHYGLTVLDLASARRTKDVIIPRHVAMYLARSLTLQTLPSISRRFGGRDHTTALSAIRKIEALIKSSVDIALDVALIERGLAEAS